MSSPNISIQVTLDWFSSPLRVQQQKPSSNILKSIYQLILCPKLHIINKQHHIHSPFAGLYQFKQGCIRCRWWIYGIRSDPKVFFTLVNHLPYLFEETITLHDKLSIREPNDRLQLQCWYFLPYFGHLFMKIFRKQSVYIHSTWL